VTVNGTPLGPYLLIERPENAIRRLFPDVRLIVRRGRPGEPVYRELFRPLPGPAASHHLRLVRALEELRGEELTAELRRLIDLDAYLRWLAFNSFVRNADSVDEVFLFQVPVPGRPHGLLRVMGWDYDDLRARRPAHPDRVLRDPLLFGAEDELDRAVQDDPVLYRRFEQIYRRMLEENLTPEHLSEVLARVERELAPVDLGWPAGRQKHFRARRARAIRDFELWLLERRAALLDFLPPGEGSG
jgi:hypothetical protein